MKQFLSVAAALLSAGAICGQQKTRYIPSHYYPDGLKAPYGNASLEPFTEGNMRMQQIFAAHTLGRKNAVITGMTIPIRKQNTARAAHMLTKLSISLGYAKTTAGNMNQNFQANRGQGAIVVFHGSYSLPPLGVGSGPSYLQWLLPFKFKQPFVYAVTHGDLLLELHNGDAYSGSQYYYPVSGAVSGQGGTVLYFGKRGKFPYIKPPLPYPDEFSIAAGSSTSWPKAFVPGSKVYFNLSYVPTSPAFLMLSAVRTSWGPIKLPLDLTKFGAPTNELNVRPDIILPMKMTYWGRAPGMPNWSGDIAIQLPNSKLLEGQVFHGQAMLLDPKSNALGLVFSDTASIAIGSTQVEVEMLWGNDNASGGRFYGEGRNSQKWLYGGPIVRFDGSFQ